MGHLLASLGVTPAVFAVHFPEGAILLEQTTCGSRQVLTTANRLVDNSCVISIYDVWS